MTLKRFEKSVLMFLVIASFIAAVTIPFIQVPTDDIVVDAATQSYNPGQINNYLANPGMGWQYMDSSNTSILPETVSYPDRQDISWKQIHTGQNTYNWSVLDQHVNQALANNKQVSFRVYTMRGEEFGGHQMPQWLVNLGVGTVDGDDAPGQPDYSSCLYQLHWGRFVEAMRQRYDGNPHIAYIDISGYGNFNEWGYHDGITEFENNLYNPSTLDGHARLRLADTFIGGSRSNHQCRTAGGATQTQSYNYPGWSDTQLIMPWAGIRQSVIYVEGKRDDVGFRHDCLGRTNHNQISQQEVLDTFGSRWRTAPNIFEVCDVNWNNTGFQNRTNDFLKFAHGSMVHDNPNGTAEPQSVIESIMKPVGYRYKVTSGTYADTVVQGEGLYVSMNWQNIGYAPSYPKMGQDFEARVYLMRANNTIAAQKVLTNRVETWMPASTIGNAPPIYATATTMNIPGGTTPGDYTLKIGVHDPRTGDRIKLAITGGNASNLYTVGTVTVLPAGGTPTPTSTPTNTPTPTPSPVPSVTIAPTSTGTPRPTSPGTTVSPTPTFNTAEPSSTVSPTINEVTPTGTEPTVAPTDVSQIPDLKLPTIAPDDGVGVENPIPTPEESFEDFSPTAVFDSLGIGAVEIVALAVVCLLALAALALPIITILKKRKQKQYFT